MNSVFGALPTHPTRYDLADAEGLLEILQSHSAQDLGTVFNEFLDRGGE